jgi:hypothetical protein
MKKLLTGIILIAASATSVMAQSAGTDNHRTWTLVITPATTKHTLDSVASAWRQESINLKFDKLNYSSSGKLTQVKGSVYVKMNAGPASGTFESDNLRSIEIKIDDRPGVSIKGK